MVTFPNYKPVYSATKKSRPARRISQFGDGYEQRLTFGLNQNPKEWTLRFDLTDEDADIVEDFLDARAADNQNFLWTPPEANTSYKWVCEEWTRELYDFKRSRIDVTFKQAIGAASQIIIVTPGYAVQTEDSINFSLESAGNVLLELAPAGGS